MKKILSIFHRIVLECILFIFRLITGIFFREIAKRGSHMVPKEGAVIFVVAPHANQFVDPLVVMEGCPRYMRFLMAASSLRKGIPGLFGKLMNCIAVERPLDLAKPASGVIKVDETNPLLLRGEGTSFTKLISNDIAKNRDQIMAVCVNFGIECYTATIEKIIDDSNLIIKKNLFPVGSPLNNEFHKFCLVPVIDQSEVYSSVFSVLESGQCIGIFPEGGSHDRAEMLPLKAGVTIMALGAMARNPSLKVTIVPVGLNYFNPDKFRSRAMVEYGEPFLVEDSLVELFRAGGDQRREACGRLLDRIYVGLCAVTVNVPDYETLQVVQATRRLYQPTSQHLNSFQLLEITRRFIKGYLVYQNDSRIQNLKKSILEYNQLLQYFHLKDHQIRTIQFSRLYAAHLLILRICQLFIYALAIMPGLVINIPAILVIDWVSTEKAKRAVVSSTVKLHGRDVLATWKLMIGVVLLPLLHLTYTLIMVVELRRHHLYLFDNSKSEVIFALLLLLIFFPASSYLAVKMAESGYQKYTSIRPLLYSVFTPHYGKTLRNIRAALKREIVTLVEEYGPRLFGSSFERQRIVPSRRPSLVEGDLAPTESADSNQHASEGDDLQSTIQKAAKSLSRSSSPMPFIDDGIDSVINGLRYMRAAVFGASSTARSDWSYVDAVEIDDIFFDTASNSNGKSKRD